MNLEEKFEKWCTKASKGSKKYAVCVYEPKANELVHVLGNEKLDLSQMYVGVFDKGKLIRSFYYYEDMDSGDQKHPKMTVIIKEEKEIICNIGAEYYSSHNKDKSMEIIILYSSKMYAEFIFAAPESIPYVVADYVTPNGAIELRFRYTKLLIEGVQAYVEQKHGTGILPEIFVDVDSQLCEEETDEEE